MAKTKKATKKQEEQVVETPAVVEETVEQVEAKEEAPKEEVSKEADAETTEEQGEDFNPSQFMSYDRETVEDLKEDSETESEPVSEDSKEDSDDGSLSWDDVETETKEEEKEEEVKQDDPWSSLDDDLNTENVEEQKTEEVVEEAKPEAAKEVPEGLDWKKVSEELGVEANSKEELLGQLNKETQEAEYNNSVIDQLQDFLKLSDRDLLQKELKMQGQMEDYEIEENLDKLEDSGMLKYQANSLRGSVRSAIKQEQQKEKNIRSEEKQTKQKRITDSRNNLKGFLKDNNMFFGGKVSETERMSIYKDICSGKLESLLYKNPETTSKVMWMLRNPNKLEKVLYGRGLEAGKAQVLDNITTPDVGRLRKVIYKVKDSSEFDAQQFMKK